MDRASEPIHIIGGGLAGSEGAWQVAQRGARVILYEMRPTRQTPVHQTDLLAELVCSNSLRADTMDRAGGVLKQELRRLGSLIISVADDTRIPAGTALAVDRQAFARRVTERIESLDGVELRREEATELPTDAIVLIASGPLTSPGLAKTLYAITGQHYLFFYDAVAPIVAADSIDAECSFRASRYDKGDADYINCPLTPAEYDAFVEALKTAERTQAREFEKDELFDACLPIEVTAGRGHDALRFGPMKPVGLVDPRTGERPWAVVQLRAENAEGTMYNLVGFQTSLKWPEQERVLRMIPALRNAEFLRYGVVHRNTYVNSPVLLNAHGQMRLHPDYFLAGQITGVEGYVEATASGLVAGVNAARRQAGKPLLTFPRETVIGSLMHYITTADRTNFQPMNANFGLLPAIPKVRGQRKLDKKLQYGKRALEALEDFLPQLEKG
jgi:methylenetetrahydrofolate--tRNA-(uracil-5-)-methyltransferase